MFRMHSRMELRDAHVAVTGASSGLGRAIALQLAAKHRAIPLLIGRRLEALTSLQAEILATSGIEATVLVADQSKTSGRTQIAQAITELEVSAVILAAAVTHVGRFVDSSPQDIEEVVATNICGLSDLLLQIIRILIIREKECAVLAISSLGAETSLPFQAVYGASKAYLNTLVRAIGAETWGSRLTLGLFAPAGVDTAMADMSELRLGKRGLMGVDRCATLAIRALIRRKPFEVPGLINKLAYYISRILDRQLVARAAALPYRIPGSD